MKRLEEMSWFDIEAHLKQDDRIILPLGATEAHGRHLGLGTDSIEAQAIAEGTAEKSGVVLAPVLSYGMSHGLMGFPGTVSLRPTTLISVLEDLISSLYTHGFRRILVVNGHGGNTASLSSAWQIVNPLLSRLRIKTFEWWTDAESYAVVVETMGPQQGSHASLGETALMLALRPQAVHLENLTGRDAAVPSGRELVNREMFRGRHPDSIMGLDPRRATGASGQALLAKCIEICARELENWA